MDYSKRADDLGTSDFFRPETGTYEITFLGEGKAGEFVFNEGTKDEKRINQVLFPIRVENEEKRWGVSEAISYSSLYGQVMLLGRYHGTLEGKTIHLTVMADKNKRSYFIQEATELIKKAEAERKEKQSTGQSQPQQPQAQPPTQQPEPEIEKTEEPIGSPSMTDRIFDKKALQDAEAFM